MDTDRVMECVELLTDLLPALRDKLGLTQREFAAVIGISRQSVIELEHKNRKITRAILIAMLTVFSLQRETARLLDDNKIYDMHYLVRLGLTSDVIRRIHCLGSE